MNVYSERGGFIVDVSQQQQVLVRAGTTTQCAGPD